MKDIFELASEVTPRREYVLEENKNLKPLQLIITNNNDNTERVNLFEIFNKNKEGIALDLTTPDAPDMDYVKKYFYENPHLTNLIRIQSSALGGEQLESVIYKINKNHDGSSSQTPVIHLLDSISKYQFQSTIVDIPYSFVLDGLSNDLCFDLVPKEPIVFSMFFSHSCSRESKDKLKELNDIADISNEQLKCSEYLGSITVENKSDDKITLDLNDFKSNMGFDPSVLKIDSLFSCFSDSNYNFGIFDSIRMVVTKGDGFSQITNPIEFASGNKYYPMIEINGKQFQNRIGDINIIGEEHSSDNLMRVIINPKTRVSFLFKKLTKNDYSSVRNKFINAISENKNDFETNVNILSAINIPDGVTQKIGKNKLSINENDFNPNAIRIAFFNENQLYDFITFKQTKEDGSVIEKTILPLNYINENLFTKNIIEIPLNFGIKISEKTELILKYKEKGDGVNMIIYESKDKRILLNEDKSSWVNIIIENKNDDVESIELVNFLEDFKGFKEGVTCTVGDNKSYDDFLSEMKDKNIKSMDIFEIHTNNTSQLVDIINIGFESTDDEFAFIPLVTQSYFSANQSNAHKLSIGYPSILEFNKDVNMDTKAASGDFNFDNKSESAENSKEEEDISKSNKRIRRQKMVAKILPNTKVVYTFRLNG